MGFNYKLIIKKAMIILLLSRKIGELSLLEIIAVHTFLSSSSNFR